MRHLLIVVAAISLAGCSGSSPAPTTPSTPTAPPVVTPAPAPTFTGTLTATNGSQPLANVAVSSGGTTDASGRFTVPAGVSALTFSGSSILTRIVNLQAPGHAFGVDAIALAGGFDLNFYRAFARNGFESPGALQPLRPRTGSIHIYLKTIDEAGQSIDTATLDATQAALMDSVGGWTGDHFSLDVTRGTNTKEGVSGWTTVKWPNPAEGGHCGLSQVGTDGGWISLNYLGTNCSCGGQSKIYPRLVRHELGHAMGYWHTDSPSDAMFGQTLTLTTQCTGGLSQREMIHARIMYSRPIGNTDPDTDPSFVLLSHLPETRVVVD